MSTEALYLLVGFTGWTVLAFWVGRRAGYAAALKVWRASLAETTDRLSALRDRSGVAQ